MDPELTEAEVEALEKLNAQVQNIIESMRIQAAYQAEQTDLMKNMMRGMIQDVRTLKHHPADYAVESPTPSTEPYQVLGISVTPDSVTKNTTSFVEDCQNDAEEKSSSEHHEIVSSSIEPDLIFENKMKTVPAVDAKDFADVDSDLNICSGLVLAKLPDVVEEEINFSHLINDSEVVEWEETLGFAKSICVSNCNLSICSHGVCQNASMDYSSYFMMRTNSDSYILVPKMKADELSVLLRNMNDFNEVESSLVCRLQLRTWIKGVQWCPYVKFVDGNFVYDKGKGHKYNKKNDLKISEHLVQDIGELKPTVFCVFPPMLYILFGFKEVILKLAWLGKPPPLPPEICHDRSVHIGNDISISEEKAYRQLFEILSDPNILEGLDNYSHLHVLHINGKVVQERPLCLTFTGDSNTYIEKGSFSIQEWDEEYRALMIEIIVECDDNDVDLSVQPNRKITDDPGGSMNSDFGDHGANVGCENGVFELISGEMQFGHHQSFVTDSDTHCGVPNEYAFNSDEGQGWSNQPNGKEMISFSHTEAGNRNVEVDYSGFGLDSDSKQAFVFSADGLVGVAGNESSLVKRSGRPKGSKKRVDKISEDYLVNQDQSVINISNLAQVKIDVVGICSIDEVLTPAIFQGDTKGPVTRRETLQGGFNEQKDGMPMLSEISTLEATNCHIDEASLHEVELHTARGVIEPVVLVFLENIPEGLILRQLKASTKIIWKGTFEVTYKFVLEAEIIMKRLPTLAESMEEMIYITELCENGSGSLWDRSKPIHDLKLSLDRLKGLVMLAFETAFSILDFSLVDPAFQACYVIKFYIFSSPRPPEVADLEDKVNFKDGGMLRNGILENLGELLVF